VIKGYRLMKKVDVLIFIFIIIIHRTIRRKFEILRSQLKERLINKCMYMYKVLITREEFE
jgi:hypothetical protein